MRFFTLGPCILFLTNTLLYTSYELTTIDQMKAQLLRTPKLGTFPERKLNRTNHKMHSI
mgnify:CR=1 FL=1